MLQDSALILIGHGSTLNPDSAAPTHQHADELRRRGLFAEVVCAFWKEEPSMREVYYMVKSRTAFIVPLFISEGYFCQEVLPRELRLTGPVTEREDKTIFYCDPVGIHPSMTRLLVKRADEVAQGVPRDQTSLIIVGHGTSLNENSRKAIEQQVALIREGGYGFAEVIDAYMEEAPLVSKWQELTSSPNVVVVPFFIADGLHSYQDIPVLLGMEAEVGAAASQREVFRHNPHALHGRQLYYSSAIGTEELMADVILDQVKDFISKHKVTLPAASSLPAIPQELPAAGGSFFIGQLKVSKTDTGSWLLRHRDDAGNEAQLTRHEGIDAAREISTYDDQGAFRPLKTAPNLRQGWQIELSDESALEAALNIFYPAALGFYHALKQGTLSPVPLRETLGRQTGMYRFTNTIRDDQAQSMVACECDAKTKCIRRITWQLDSMQQLTQLTPEKQPVGIMECESEIPLLCVEACTHLVSAARTIAQRNHKEQKAMSS